MLADDDFRKKRYDTNPFLDNLTVTKKSKIVTVSPMGKNDNVIINQSTGEIKGTSINTYKAVDNETFIKLFTQNIALTFDLTASGLKALNVLIYAVQYTAINKDEVFLDSKTLKRFFADNPNIKKITNRTFLSGLASLVDAKIIAKSTRLGIYFINPSFMFNGDRIAFTTIIERKRKTDLEKLEDNGQMRLVD